MKNILETHIPPEGQLGRGHKGLYDTINNSIHFQLGLASRLPIIAFGFLLW